jgi:hypothetical protein
MRAEVRYDVPVSAWVNLETGLVERVDVWCEGIEQRDDECAIVTAEQEKPMSDPRRERVQEIVDYAIWPAWNLS